MKKIYGLLLLLILTFLFMKLLLDKNPNNPDKQINKQSTLPTEQFIQNHLLTNGGMIQTDFHNNKGGEIILSESMGLWMKYLAEKSDVNQFEEALQAMKNHLLLSNNLVAWRIRAGEKAETNALIDDIRIVESLYIMGEKTQNEHYIEEAHNIAKSVIKYNMQNDMFVDFYDVEHRYANEQLTLSYLNYKSFEYMEQHQVISTKSLNKIKEFMEIIPFNNGFYPKYYDLTDQTFHNEATINLIDQLYIATYLEQAKIETDEFFDWLKDTFYEQNVLFGRYDRRSKIQAVNYESAAVYALAIFYVMTKEDSQFAKDLYKQMVTLQVQEDTSPYFGGYVNDSLTETHSFDNLLSLLAERILFNEQIIK